MRLVPVAPPEPTFTADCAKCGARFNSAKLLADLDGEPFVSYYCAGCASQIRETFEILTETQNPKVKS